MKELVIYFSRADENYGVGNIKVGNTELIANEIQKIRNADIFKCKPAIPYSKIIQSAVMKQKNTKKATLDLN